VNKSDRETLKTGQKPTNSEVNQEFAFFRKIKEYQLKLRSLLIQRKKLSAVNGLDEIGEGFFQAMLMENSAFFVS